MTDTPNSPLKSTTKSASSSTKVIDSLHSKIDELTDELTALKQSHQELTKKHSITAKKNDSFVDQLANAKHENDMLSALLKRKERRILDLEDQFNELTSQNESLVLSNKNMKIRCENLQSNSNANIAEFERLKISYDALIASQMEYKNHYQQELNSLQTAFDNYKLENTRRFEELQTSIVSNDKDIDTLLDSLTNKRKAMDNIYVNKNNKVLQLLGNLAHLAKLHGQDTKSQVEQNVSVIEQLLAKHPDLQEKILEKEKIEVDLAEIIAHSNDVLANSSFDEDTTLINSPDLENNQNFNTTHSTSGSATPNSNSHSLQSKKRKNYKRNSLILKELPPIILENVPSSLPKKPQVNNNLINIPKARSKFNTPPTTPRQTTPRQFTNHNNDFEVTHQWNGTITSITIVVTTVLILDQITVNIVVTIATIPDQIMANTVVNQVSKITTITTTTITTTTIIITITAIMVLLNEVVLLEMLTIIITIMGMLTIMVTTMEINLKEDQPIITTTTTTAKEIRNFSIITLH